MLELITKLFSVKPGSMRAWRWRRVLVVVWLFPLFGLIATWNQIGLALDWMFYPGFRKQPIQKPVFIVSLPRTGTTNLLHGMTDAGMPFTALALWESLIAPSVTQKKMLRFLWRNAPSFIQSLLRKTDAKLFKGLNVIHKTSLFCKEEDELALMWSLSTAYMGFFYPETEVFRDMHRFDRDVSPARKRRIMTRYQRLIQRHLYALPDGARRRFVAKNPLMPFKVQALAAHFPDATAVLIERDPKRVLPSAEQLILHLLDFATDVPLSDQERQSFIDLIEDDQHHLHAHLALEPVMPGIVIRFPDLVQRREEVLTELLSVLGCEETPVFSESAQATHKTPARYTPWTEEELSQVLSRPWPSWPNAMCLLHEEWQAPGTRQSQDHAKARG